MKPEMPLFLAIVLGVYGIIAPQQSNQSHQISRQIKVLFTAAIIEDPEGIRKACYIRNLQHLKRFGCDVYVVESCQQGPTYLDTYCEHVCYTQSNDPSQTKSNNEITSLAIGMKHFNFDPDDMIIKVTGRYVLEDDQFVRLVNERRDADIVARIWNPADAYTGYFAIKQARFLELIDHYFEVYRTISRGYSFEHALGNYISSHNNSLHIAPIEKLYSYPYANTSRR